METYGNSGAIGASMPYGGPSMGASMPYGASVPMGGPSMGASVPMGTSAGLQGTMPFVVQPGPAGLVGSATAGDFPHPGPGPARPIMTSVAAPPVVGGAPQNPISYGPSYNMSYHVRSTADKTAVKYTGFLPMEGVFEEDTCRIG